ncbi:hypothetical protein [Mycobacterium bohemicum]|nr:hypothetical protein [Mycobacterium bohemicum]MCV6970320.1 hypothetical protein [Mycobacterium bohemicum]
MSAAWAEDKAGELVQLTHQIGDRSRAGRQGLGGIWQQLVEAFGNVVAADLADRLNRALSLRNEVIHGVFLGGKDSPPFWFTMKRQFSKRDPAAYGMAGQWTVATSRTSRRSSPTLRI